MNTLAGKTAVVTGASRGKGRVVALALARAGAQVIVHCGHSAHEAETVVREIRGIGSRSDAISVDLSTREGPHQLARRVRAIVGDRLDILVANAGMSTRNVVRDNSVEDFDQQLALNVRAPFFLIQQLLPIMCMGSNVTFLLQPTRYATAQLQSIDAAIGGAMETLIRHLASTLGERGIRVNALAEGSGQTERLVTAGTVARHDTAPEGQAPEGYAASRGIEGVGSVVAFLASDAARWITGDIVRIDGRATP
jgi:3-oxoacyl-[acyl-carrier protein] reductase